MCNEKLALMREMKSPQALAEGLSARTATQVSLSANILLEAIGLLAKLLGVAEMPRGAVEVRVAMNADGA
jgi:hypothetical protein